MDAFLRNPHRPRRTRARPNTPPALLATWRTAGGRPCLDTPLLAEMLVAMLGSHPATLAACLLPDHLHWLLRSAARDAIPRFETWSERFAARLGLRGKLWRPLAVEIREVGTPDLIAERILGNPVRLRLVSTPGAWPWSIRIDDLRAD